MSDPRCTCTEQIRVEGAVFHQITCPVLAAPRLPDPPAPTVSPEEHRRVQAELEQRTAEAAAMRRALEDALVDLEEDPDWDRTTDNLATALSSSAGSALLEEMAEAQTQRDAMTDNCHRLMAERDQARAESADLRARLEAVEKERDGAVRDLDGLREAWGNERAEFVQRDAALRLAMRQGLEAGVEEVVVALAQEQMAADAHAPAAWCAAEVCREVEAEREACAAIADHHASIAIRTIWESDKVEASMRAVAAAIRSRGKE